MKIKDIQDSLRLLNGNMNKKVLEMIKKREKVIWDYGRINSIMVYEDNEHDMDHAKLVMPTAFDMYDYKVSIKYIRNSSELNNHTNVRYYMSFINYSDEYCKDLEIALCDLKSQHVIVVTAYNYEDVKDIVEKYGCYFLPKPYTKEAVIAIIDKIQEDIPQLKIGYKHENTSKKETI